MNFTPGWRSDNQYIASHLVRKVRSPFSQLFLFPAEGVARLANERKKDYAGWASGFTFALLHAAGVNSLICVLLAAGRRVN